MSLTKFRAKAGFDANNETIVNVGDPIEKKTGGGFDDLAAVNWRTLRAHTGLRIVADEAARQALEQAAGELIVGDIVVDQDTGLAWKYIAAGKWEPFGRGGLKYVGRQGNLPDPSVDLISHGEMFIVRLDFSGKDLYRVVAWDETIPARTATSPMLITHTTSKPAPVLGQPTIAQLTFDDLPGVANAEADIVIRLATDAGGSHLFLYRIQPGEDLDHVVRMLTATYNAAPHDPDVSATANGHTLVLTGSPGSPALSGRTISGGAFIGEVTADAQIQTFLGGTGRTANDFVVNGTAGDLQAPDGQVLPPDTALIIESLAPLMYHVADGPTPLPPIGNGIQDGSGVMTAVTQLNALINWLNSSPALGDYVLNAGTQTLAAGGFTLPANTAIVQTPAGPRLASSPTPPTQRLAGGIQMNPSPLTGITDQASLDQALADPANQVTGVWWANTTGGTLLLYQAQNNPTARPGANYNIDADDWLYWDPDFNGSGVAAWNGRAGLAKGGQAPGSNIGAKPVAGAYDPPNPAPEAVYPIAQQPPATPVATVAAQAQVDPTRFSTFVAAIINPGPTVTPPGGGWRWLNREVWSKDLRSGRDQQTDQRAGDLQVTRERAHQELKAYNSVSGQWDTIYSRDEINAAIAALSLFEGTINEVGGGAIGALELDALPDLAARTATKDLSEVSHYWTWIGSPNYAVDANTPRIGSDLDGAILNPGDWIQIANRGGDGSGVGANGGPPQLAWVTVGGDLLAKARADRLFGLLPWARGGWEQGALVLFDGDVYRALQPVTSSDPNPDPQPTALSIPLTPVKTHVLTGAAVDVLPAAANDGDVETATGAGTISTTGAPFEGLAYSSGDSFVYTSDPGFAGKGVSGEGFAFDQGWIAIGQTQPIPDPVVVTAPIPQTPWQKVDISGGLKVSQDDAGLPATAPPGQVWIVLQSAQANGEQALYAYDNGSGTWQELGGGSGTPLDLSMGTIVYPKVIYVDQELPGALQGSAIPSVTLPTLMTSTYLSLADIQTSPPDGSAGTAGEWWVFAASFPPTAVPGWDNEPPFTPADVLVSLGDPTLNGTTTDGRRIIDGVLRQSGLNSGDQVTGFMQVSGVPSPEIAGDVLATRNQAGFPLIKAISKDGKTWQWYHPHRLTQNLTGQGRNSKADYPMQLNIGFANGQSRITHIANRNLDWVELQQSAIQNPIGGVAGGNVQGRPIDLVDGRLYRYSGFYRTTTSTKSVFIAPRKADMSRVTKGNCSTLFTARLDHSSNNQGGTFDPTHGGTDGFYILSGTDDIKQNEWHPFNLVIDLRSPTRWLIRLHSEYIRSNNNKETSITVLTGPPAHIPQNFYFSSWNGETSEWQVFDDV